MMNEKSKQSKFDRTFPFSHFSLDTESGEHSNMPALPWFHTDVEKDNKYKNQSKTSDDNSVASQGKLKKATIKQETNQARSKCTNRTYKSPKIKRSKANRVHMLLPPHCFQIRRRLPTHWSYLVLPLISAWSWQEQRHNGSKKLFLGASTAVVELDITESPKVQKSMQ